MKFVYLAAAAVCVLAASSAEAATYVGAAPLPNLGTTITFNDNISSGTVVNNQYAASGVTFGSGLYKDNSTYSSNVSGGAITNFGPSGCSANASGICEGITIDFASVTSAASFSFISNAGTTAFSSFLGGQLVETFNASTGLNGEYYGFTNSAFDRVLIAPGGSNGAGGLDNLSFGSSAVPEPATWAMMMVGFGGIGFAMRRKKTTTSVRFA